MSLDQKPKPALSPPSTPPAVPPPDGESAAGAARARGAALKIALKMRTRGGNGYHADPRRAYHPHMLSPELPGKALEAASDAIIIVDTAGVIRLASRRITALAGHLPQECPGR